MVNSSVVIMMNNNDINDKQKGENDKPTALIE